MFNFWRQFQQPYLSSDNSIRMENPAIRKGLDRITTSLNQLGDTFEKAFEVAKTSVLLICQIQ